MKNQKKNKTRNKKLTKLKSKAQKIPEPEKHFQRQTNNDGRKNM